VSTSTTRLMDLYCKTRKWRRHYRATGDQIAAAYCACREQAIIDCMMALGELEQAEAVELAKFR
jgi:hypothetical protein